MNVIEDRDVGEVMDEIYSDHFDRLQVAFGRDEACDAIEDTFDEVYYDDIADEIEEHFIELVKYCAGDEPLTSDQMARLELDYETCKENGIETVEELDENGDTVEYEVEDSRQMKFWPEMEAGMKPMKVRKAVA